MPGDGSSDFSVPFTLMHSNLQEKQKKVTSSLPDRLGKSKSTRTTKKGYFYLPDRLGNPKDCLFRAALPTNACFYPDRYACWMGTILASAGQVWASQANTADDSSAPGRGPCSLLHATLTLYFLSFPLSPAPCLLRSKWNLLQ